MDPQHCIQILLDLPENLFLPGLLIPGEELAGERAGRLVAPLPQQVLQVALPHRQVAVLLQQLLLALRHLHRLLKVLVLDEPVNVIILVNREHCCDVTAILLRKIL